MEFWVVREGEKEGPMLDFDLRSRIRSGEVKAEQKVWYSDLEEWTPIGEVELFANEFKVTTVTDENVEGYLSQLDDEIEPATPKPPPVPVELHIWRRFGARWFDYMAYMAVVFILVLIFKVDLIGLQQKALFPFVLILPWIFLETASLHFWGTTPGKWLAGLKVRGPFQQNLSAGAALLRTMRVMILGMGFAQPVLREICQALAFWFATKKKVVLWDTPVGTRLERIQDLPQKWVALGVGIVGSLLIIMAASYQIVHSQMSPEELQEMEGKIERMLNPQKK